MLGEATLRIYRLAACVLLASSSVTSAAELPPPPATGPVAVGMSIEDALSATPGMTWEKAVSPVTGRTLEIRARSAWTLEGYSYAVRLRPQAYRWSTLELTGWKDGGDRDTCRKQVLALARHLEPHFPRMSVSMAAVLPSPPPAGSIVAQRSPEGYLTVTGQPGLSPEAETFRQEFIPVGATARVRQTIVNDDRATWEFEQAASDAYPYALRVFSYFDELAWSDDAGPDDEPGPACVIEATLQAKPKGRPDFDLLDMKKVKPIARPAPALLHDTLDGMDLPAAGITLPFRCQVVRQKGTLEQCMQISPVDSSFNLFAAQRRLFAYRFDPKQLDADSDVPLHAMIDVRFLPKDRDPKRSAAAGPVPIWTKVATSSQLSREYPPDALRNDVQALVTATCRIRADLSLECLSFDTIPADLKQFHRPAERVLSHYRAASRLKNDLPAAGAIVQVRIRFQIE